MPHLATVDAILVSFSIKHLLVLVWFGLLCICGGERGHRGQVMGWAVWLVVSIWT